MKEEKFEDLILFLGLDVSQRFFDILGLPIENKDIFFNALKEINQKILTSYAYLPEYAQEGWNVLKNNPELTTSKEYKTFENWLAYTYSDPNRSLFIQPEWFDWKNVLGYMYGNLKDSEEKGVRYFGSELQAQKFIEGYKNMLRKIDSDNKKYKKIKSEPFTSWDKKLLDQFTYFKSLKDFHFIRNTIHNKHEKEFIIPFLRSLVADEKNQLYVAAQNYLTNTQLIHPDVLLEAFEGDAMVEF